MMSWEPIDIASPSENDLIGDDPFDAFADAVRVSVSAYKRDLGRRPSVRELVETFKRVLETRLSTSVQNGRTVELVSLNFDLRTIPKRQRCRVGDFLVAKLADGRNIYGRLLKKDPVMGQMVAVYDSAGLESPPPEKLRMLPLIVKPTPIHFQALEDGDWIIAGHLPVEEWELNVPEGPHILSGSNLQLMAANQHYGLSRDKGSDSVIQAMLLKPTSGRH